MMNIIFNHLNSRYDREIRLIGQVGRVFASGPEDLGSIPGCIIPKTLKMVLDTSLLNTQQYKVCIKSKVEQSRERSTVLGVVAIEKGAFWLPSTLVAIYTFYFYSILNRSINIIMDCCYNGNLMDLQVVYY